MKKIRDANAIMGRGGMNKVIEAKCYDKGGTLKGRETNANTESGRVR